MNHGLAEAAVPLHGGHRANRAGVRVLAASAVLLPATTRARWLQAWTGELPALPGRRARTRFTLQVLSRMFRLAVVLRRTTTRKPTGA